MLLIGGVQNRIKRAFDSNDDFDGKYQQSLAECYILGRYSTFNCLAMKSLTR